MFYEWDEKINVVYFLLGVNTEVREETVSAQTGENVSIECILGAANAFWCYNDSCERCISSIPVAVDRVEQCGRTDTRQKYHTSGNQLILDEASLCDNGNTYSCTNRENLTCSTDVTTLNITHVDPSELHHKSLRFHPHNVCILPVYTLVLQNYCFKVHG